MNNIRARTTRLRPYGIDPSTPDGLSRSYVSGAAECRDAARKLVDDLGNLTSEYILTFHAIELGLKAFLVKHGLTEGQLKRKPYGHNLIVLFKEAERRGLVLSLDNTDELITSANEWHDNAVKIRYDFTETRTLPMCQEIFPLIDEILVACH
jgi:HEPN domain-containing protein